MMKDIYILSCAEDGGIYRYGFQNGELIFKDKTPLDRPMYAIKRDGKMLVILRETDTQNHFGGFLSFDIAEDGSLVKEDFAKKGSQKKEKSILKQYSRDLTLLAKEGKLDPVIGRDDEISQLILTLLTVQLLLGSMNRYHLQSEANLHSEHKGH